MPEMSKVSKTALSDARFAFLCLHIFFDSRKPVPEKGRQRQEVKMKQFFERTKTNLQEIVKSTKAKKPAVEGVVLLLLGYTKDIITVMVLAAVLVVRVLLFAVRTLWGMFSAVADELTRTTKEDEARAAERAAKETDVKEAT